jgi:cytochrome P450
LREAHRCQQELIAYFNDLIELHLRQPKDGVLSELIGAQVGGAVVGHDELLATCVLLLFASHETTTNLIGNGVLALLNHPHQWATLRENPSLVPAAVEELLRYDSPVQAAVRRTTRELNVGDHVIAPKEFVMLLLGSANRDPARFDHPDTLDLQRSNKRQLAFGLGPHFCLGAALARLEGQLAIRALVERLPVLELTDAPRRRRHFYLRGLERLPIRLASAPT